MKEQDLIDLKFVKNEEDGWYYYTKEFGNNEYSSLNFCLISSANDELKNNKWTVEVFDYPFIKLTELSDLIQFITLIEKIIKETKNK